MLPELRTLTLTLDFATMMTVRELLLTESREASDRAAAIDPEDEMAWTFIPEERAYATHMSEQAEVVYWQMDTFGDGDGWAWDEPSDATATA